ncbi:MAG: GTPase [Clostridia bacterium]|nr:GTPase [Clostridia bacterium]
MQEVSVYLFLGFLEGGKTKFIQETLEDPRMNTGERTMLLICEEGETEYEPKKFKVDSVAVVTLESKDELNMGNLTALTKKYKAQRVIVEFNGTWLLNDFFDAMPESWVINQMMTFVDSSTFLNYNANMRQLVYDKIYMTQMVVFNRFKDDYDKMAFHKVVRAISRRPDIVYDYLDGRTIFDDIDDPLPFDKEADNIRIEDRDFAWFYRDIAENTMDYADKIVTFKGMAAVSRKNPKGYIVLGRHIMTCCEADIAYDGFAVNTNNLLQNIQTRDWLLITAKITIGYSPMYRQEGPIFNAITLEPTDPPAETVATYY